MNNDTQLLATLRLPAPVKAMSAMAEFTTKHFGPCVTMREEPKGWLRFELPKKEATNERTIPNP